MGQTASKRGLGSAENRAFGEVPLFRHCGHDKAFVQLAVDHPFHAVHPRTAGGGFAAPVLDLGFMDLFGAHIGLKTGDGLRQVEEVIG